MTKVPEVELRLAAIHWWKQHRPLTWRKAQHLAHPTINTRDQGEARLARAVAKIEQLEANKEYSREPATRAKVDGRPGHCAGISDCDKPDCQCWCHRPISNEGPSSTAWTAEKCLHGKALSEHCALCPEGSRP